MYRLPWRNCCSLIEAYFKVPYRSARSAFAATAAFSFAFFGFHVFLFFANASFRKLVLADTTL